MTYSWDAGARPTDGMEYELMDDGTAWKCVKCWRRVDDGHLAGKDHQKQLAWWVHGPGNPLRQGRAQQAAVAAAAAGSAGRTGASGSAAAAGFANQPPLGQWQQRQVALQDVPYPGQDGPPPQQPGGQPVGPPQPPQQPGGQPVGPPPQLPGQPQAFSPPFAWERGIERRLEHVEAMVMEMRDILERLEAMALRQQQVMEAKWD